MIPPRPSLRAFRAYQPGEQPSDPATLKLNTNEFPYAPAPAVLEAIRQEAAESIRLYPSPRCDRLRASLAALHGVEAGRVLVTNGSDEALRLIMHAYAAPGRMIATTWPTYSLYPTLALAFETPLSSIELTGLERLPEELFSLSWEALFLSSPNPPLGTFFPLEAVRRLAAPGGLLVLDLAYADFADEPDRYDPLLKLENVITVCTFSKAYGLAGLRLGYAVGGAEAIGLLSALADSYNVNRISQAAGLAALASAAYYAPLIREIRRERSRLTAALTDRGFRVPPSQANFIFAFHPAAREVQQRLRRRRVLVRHFDDGALAGGLRISIGTPEQHERLLAALDEVLDELNIELAPAARGPDRP